MPRFLIVAAVLVTGFVAAPLQQTPQLDQLLRLAAGYADRYFEVMSSLTAEERYRQSATTPKVEISGGRFAPGAFERRELRSDVVILRVGPPIEWRTYRDVFEVDGKPVRDRADRLAKLFGTPADTARSQALRIASEGSRFNITNLGRTLNEPGLPIAFLQPSDQPRFRFTLGRRDRDVGETVWAVSYREEQRPTIFRHNTTTDNPSSGRLWLDADTGAVLKTEHIVSPDPFRAEFVTTFRHEGRFGVALPVRMTERLVSGTHTVQGVATYDHYRRFEVRVEEGVTTP
jgi:hypothetical protein